MAEDNWKTIRVPKDVYENAKERKEAYDVTWGEYVSPHKWHSVFDEPSDAQEDGPVIEANFEEMLDASTADIEELERKIMGRLDDLEAQLPRRVAKELQR